MRTVIFTPPAPDYTIVQKHVRPGIVLIRVKIETHGSDICIAAGGRDPISAFAKRNFLTIARFPEMIDALDGNDIGRGEPQPV